MALRIDLSQQRFGRLTVIEDVGKKNRLRLWKCLCDCGKEVVKPSALLLRGNNRSCGCLRKDTLRAMVMLSVGESAFRLVFGRYKKSAEVHGREFSLTKDQFRHITTQNCFYCGCEPSSITKIKKGNGSFIHNGIDRADNNLGYTLENSVPCCTDCNFFKGSRHQKDFLSKVAKIYEVAVLR